jgi:hypothetical protein
MSVAQSGENLGRQISRPDELAQLIREFGQSDDLLMLPDRMAAYPNKWVAAYAGEVVDVDDDLNTIVARLEARALPLAVVAIRFIREGGLAAE